MFLKLVLHALYLNIECLSLSYYDQAHMIFPQHSNLPLFLHLQINDEFDAVLPEYPFYFLFLLRIINASHIIMDLGPTCFLVENHIFSYGLIENCIDLKIKLEIGYKRILNTFRAFTSLKCLTSRVGLGV